MNIIIAVLIFCLIVIFHEWGHFLAAKACGVKVNEFCLGFGPTLVSHQGKETLYSIKLLPFGGACIMEGEEESSDDARSFGNKSVWQRMLIVLAGPFFNFILAFLMSIVLIACVGVNYPVLTGVSEGGPAEQAGLEAGDELVSLNGHKLHFYSEISVYLYFHHDADMSVTYIRDGEKHTTSLTPVYSEDYGRYMLGVVGGAYEKRGGVFEVIKYSFYEVGYQIYSCIESLKFMLAGNVSLSEVSGPVGIVKTIGDTYEASAQVGAYYVFLNMLSIAILLSANLGVMNLLPIPALDGGRFFLYVIEAIRRKKMTEKVEMAINFTGLALLMILMVVIMANDIYKLF